MADTRTVTLKGNSLTLAGDELAVGQAAPDFTLTGVDMKDVKLADTSGVRIFNIVPSLDTPTCDAQTRRFNQEASSLDGVTIYTVSRDLPFAQKRWCGAADANDVVMLSDYKDGNFGAAWGLMLNELKVLARAVYVVDSSGKIVYSQIVPEVSNEPDYEAALAAARDAS